MEIKPNGMLDCFSGGGVREPPRQPRFARRNQFEFRQLVVVSAVIDAGDHLGSEPRRIRRSIATVFLTISESLRWTIFAEASQVGWLNSTPLAPNSKTQGNRISPVYI